ncbi:hypothetical protein N7513_003199 [Penicillium frequentans]|nr:hypothetical protein N7513_003178 [Penicillium glabrum]KAJ5557613.1 hypothetical protein N7513_003199 [Penicillium glabrum]
MKTHPGYVDASAYPGRKWLSAEDYKLNWGLKTTSSPAILPQRRNGRRSRLAARWLINWCNLATRSKGALSLLEAETSLSHWKSEQHEAHILRNWQQWCRAYHRH